MLVLAVFLLGWGCSKDESSGVKKATAFPNSVVDDETLVFVNSAPITGKELRVFTLLYRAGDDDSLSNSAFNLRMLDGLIDRTLIWQEANTLGLTVDDSTSDWYVQQFIRSAGGVEAIDAAFAEMGVTRNDLETTIKKDLAVKKLLEVKIAPGTEVSDSIAWEYYWTNPNEFVTPDSIRARHIILRASPGDPQSVKDQKIYILKDLRARAQAGEDFAALAKEYSEGPTGPRGGDLGYFTARDMVRPFSEAAFALEPGQVSNVVQTEFGYHLIKVEDKIPSRKLAYKDIQENLKQQIRQFVIAQKLQNHLQASREVAIIKNNY